MRLLSPAPLGFLVVLLGAVCAAAAGLIWGHTEALAVLQGYGAVAVATTIGYQVAAANSQERDLAQQRKRFDAERKEASDVELSAAITEFAVVAANTMSYYQGTITPLERLIAHRQAPANAKGDSPELEEHRQAIREALQAAAPLRQQAWANLYRLRVVDRDDVRAYERAFPLMRKIDDLRLRIKKARKWVDAPNVRIDSPPAVGKLRQSLKADIESCIGLARDVREDETPTAGPPRLAPVFDYRSRLGFPRARDF